MKIRNCVSIKNLLLFTFLIVLAGFGLKSCTYGKDTSSLEDNYTAYKKAIEYEAVRYLVEDVLEIEEEERIDIKLVEMTHSLDSYGGSLFHMIGFSHESTKGIIATSFNTIVRSRENIDFTSTALSKEQIAKLDLFIKGIDAKSMSSDDFKILQLSPEITVNVYKKYSKKYIDIWMPSFNKLTFRESQWKTLISSFNQL